MKKRIICDTCSAIKLAQFGAGFFTSVAPVCGKVVLHPVIFRELSKWHPEKKERYKSQIAVLTTVRSEPGIGVTGSAFATQEILIKATRDELGLSVGKADIEQLISALEHDLDLITNDAPLTKLAENFEVTVFEAEEIVLIAFQNKLISSDNLTGAIAVWLANEEKKPSKTILTQFSDLGFKL